MSVKFWLCNLLHVIKRLLSDQPNQKVMMTEKWAQKFHKMTCFFPDLGRTFDWLKQVSLTAWPIRSTAQIRVVTHHQYMKFLHLVPQTSFHFVLCWGNSCLFSQARLHISTLNTWKSYKVVILSAQPSANHAYMYTIKFLLSILQTFFDFSGDGFLTPFWGLGGSSFRFFDGCSSFFPFTFLSSILPFPLSSVISPCFVSLESSFSSDSSERCTGEKHFILNNNVYYELAIEVLCTDVHQNVPPTESEVSCKLRVFTPVYYLSIKQEEKEGLHTVTCKLQYRPRKAGWLDMSTHRLVLLEGESFQSKQDSPWWSNLVNKGKF